MEIFEPPATATSSDLSGRRSMSDDGECHFLFVGGSINDGHDDDRFNDDSTIDKRSYE